MGESVFSRLFRYRATENLNPSENYLTELLCWMINNIPSFAEDYVRLLIDNCSNGKDELRSKLDNITSISSETQVCVPNGFIDLVILTDTDIGFICEHKINSKLNVGQLDKYRDNQDQIYKDKPHNYKIVLLTKTKKQHDQNPDIPLVWKDVFDHYTKRLANYSDNERLFVEQFLLYLTEEGMGEQKPINSNAIKNYCEALQVPDRLRAIFAAINEEMSDDDWEKECPGIVSFVSGFKVVVRSHWGRLGLEFSDRDKWAIKPSLFAGVVLNNNDHALVDINNEPQFVVLIDRDKQKKEEDPYNKIIEKIKQGLTAIDLEGTGFKKESDPQNQWRLFILKKPLSELLVVDDFAEQKKTLKKNIIAGLNCILKCCKDL